MRELPPDAPQIFKWPQSTGTDAVHNRWILDAIAGKIGTPTDILIAIIGKALEIRKTPVTGHFERVGKGSNELLREQL